MALHKLNVLGWHLTDDQGWRLEIKKYPRLTSVGAWRVPAGRAALRDIDPQTGQPAPVRRLLHPGGRAAHRRARRGAQRHHRAGDRHAGACERGHRRLPAAGRHGSAATRGAGRLGHLSRTSSTWRSPRSRFIEDVLDEVMALFPGQYIHVGGDEAVKDQWQASPRVQARMRELSVPSEEALQGYFTHRLDEYLRAHGRRLVGWDEILEGGLPPDATVMSWRGVQGAISAAAAGHDTVLSPDPMLYLDHRQGSIAERATRPRHRRDARGCVSLRPAAGHRCRGEPQHVLGLQANLWTEHVRTEERAAYMTWPRAAALAEVGWSPAARLDYADFLKRLPLSSSATRALGVHYSDDVFAPARRVAPNERHHEPGSQHLHRQTGLIARGRCAARRRARGVSHRHHESVLDPPRGRAVAGSHTHRRGRPGSLQLPDRQGHRGHQAQPPAHPGRRARGARRWLRRRPRGACCRSRRLPTTMPSRSCRRWRCRALPGVHDLCFKFTQRTLDPMWAIDWLQVSP